MKNRRRIIFCEKCSSHQFSLWSVLVHFVVELWFCASCVVSMRTFGSLDEIHCVLEWSCIGSRGLYGYLVEQILSFFPEKQGKMESAKAWFHLSFLGVQKVWWKKWSLWLDYWAAWKPGGTDCGNISFKARPLFNTAFNYLIFSA